MATPRDVSLQMTRNIGIMAHIDAVYLLPVSQQENAVVTKFQI